MKLRREQGFTLIELLVSLALIGIILLAILNLNTSVFRSSASVQNRASLLQETQVMQNYVASRLRQAVYVYPNTTPIVLTTSGSSATTQAPNGTYTFTIGTDPLIAFIQPPSRPGSGNCTQANQATPPVGITQENSCYAFFAYYAIKRDRLTGGTTGANNPGQEPLNDGVSWVLMEYRAYFPPNTFPVGVTITPTLANTYTKSLSGKLVLDYLSPASATATLSDAQRIFRQVDGSAAGPTSVTLNFGATRNVGGQVISVPLATPSASRFSFTVYPRNINQVGVFNN